MSKKIKHANFQTSIKVFSFIKRLPTFSLCVSLLFVSLIGFNANHAVEARPTVQSLRLPDTPFLPPFTGHIQTCDFHANPQADGGITYNITFETAEQPLAVLNWYKSAFKSFGWSLRSDAPGQYQLSAIHGNNVQSDIYLMSPTKAGARAQVQLYYRYIGHEM